MPWLLGLMTMLSHWCIQCTPLIIFTLKRWYKTFVDHFSLVLVYKDSEILPDSVEKRELIHKKDCNKRRNTC